MSTPNGRAISAYVRTGIETAVPEADPHRLIVMLFEGALAAIAEARMKLMGGDVPGRGKAISKAISIVQDGLRASLDSQKGGELAQQLGALYEYITMRLLHANVHARQDALDEAAHLISELHAAWTAIAPGKPAASSGIHA
ncbi:MAG: flagellar export chaperone FliS [Burkholderiales bacterium]